MGENMDVGNTFAVMSAFAFLSVLPVALAIEGPRLQAEWTKAVAKGTYTEQERIFRIIGSGLTFYLYNEVRSSVLLLPFCCPLCADARACAITRPSLCLSHSLPRALVSRTGFHVHVGFGTPHHARRW